MRNLNSKGKLQPRMKFKKTLLKIVVAILVVAAAGGSAWYYRFIYSYERWFETNLVSTLWTPMKQKQVSEILSQPFVYCGQGSTSRAYVSADGQFVIKTFLQNKFVSRTVKSIPIIRELANRRKELRAKYNRIFGAIHAYQYMPEESGMIYYQFIRPTYHFHQVVQLIEKDGSITWLNPNEEEYLIQKKAVIVSEYLLKHLEQGDIEKAKSGIAKLLQMTKILYDQGIVVTVLQFLDNFGFLDDEPMRIDVEHICFDSKWKKAGKTHFKKEVALFRHWVEENASALIPSFDETVQKLNLE